VDAMTASAPIRLGVHLVLGCSKDHLDLNR
jgi:hypothetical protein